MTPEYGAPSQLEKIDMLELADARGAEQVRPARRGGRAARRAQAVAPQSPGRSERATTQVPVFATVASRWDDPGIERCYAALRGDGSASARRERFAVRARVRAAPVASPPSLRARRRASRYLAEIAETRARLSRAHRELAEAARAAPRRCARSGRALASGARPNWRDALASASAARRSTALARARAAHGARGVARAARALRAPTRRATRCAGARFRVENHGETLSGTQLPRVALPRGDELGRARALPAPREPARARSRSPRACSRSSARARTRRACSRARATPERTNRRFHLLAAGQPARAALDRLRQRDALRPRSRTSGPTSAARSATRASRSAPSTTRRSSTRASTCCDPEHLGLDDDQRPRADGARVLPERRDRPGASSGTCARRAGSTRVRARFAARGAARATTGELPAGPRRPRPRPARHRGRRGRRRRDLRAHPRRRAAHACAAPCRPTS